MGSSLTKTLYFCGMILNDALAVETAKILLQINAIKLEPQNPFTWASGIKSPIYCDNRLCLSHPQVRRIFAQSIATHLKSKFPETQIIAGVATGAIGMGLLVAEQLDLPFVYVRPEPKKHGRKNQIEGQFTAGQKVVIIEDLISTGKSSLMAAEVLDEAGLNIQAMYALFTYKLNIATQNFNQVPFELYTLSDYDFLLKAAIEHHYIQEQDLNTLAHWRENPEQWQVNTP